MKKMLIGAALVVAVAVSAQAIVALNDTVGVMDTAGLLSGENAGNTKSFAEFTNDVAAAFAVDLGGVVDFNHGAFTPDEDGFTSAYGASAAQTLTAVADAGYSQLMIASFSSVNEPSDPNSLYTQSFSGGDPVVKLLLSGADIIELGFFANSRNGQTGDMVYTAEFSGGGNSALTQAMTGVAGDNFFLQFAAPAGETITALTIDGSGISGGNFFSTDDLGFIAIPEPGTLVLLGIGGLLVGLRRRK